MKNEDEMVLASCAGKQRFSTYAVAQKVYNKGHTIFLCECGYYHLAHKNHKRKAKPYFKPKYNKGVRV